MFNSHLFPLMKRLPLQPLLAFTLCVNGLLLIPSWYMLEVYDRVVMSRNVTTLLMLTVLALLLLALMECLNYVRYSLLSQAGARLVLQTQSPIFDAGVRRGVQTNQAFSGASLEQLRKIQQLYQAPTLLAVLDLPFALIFLLCIYSISMVLGHITVLIAAMVVVLTILNERATHPSLTKANQIVAQSQQVLNNIVKNAEVIRAMQMTRDLQTRWKSKHFDYLHHQSQASLAATFYQSASKLLQQLLGSAMLGVGSWLLLQGDLPIGGSGMIISSILATRFVTPLIQLISGWKVLTNAIDATQQLDSLLKDYARPASQMTLPAPQGQLSVEQASVKLPMHDGFILKQINVALRPGQCMVLIGPSGAGKTTLGRLIAGALSPDHGYVRLDGVPLFDWDKQQVGPHIGYLPQEIELHEGSIADNIARFVVDADPAKALQAATLAGLGDFLDLLPQGIDTQVGGEGVTLPGGKRQLIGLARAMYHQPRLLVLDEPNSNLDKAGEQALKNALQHLKAAGTTLVMITHHKAYIEFADVLMLLMGGEVRLLGPTQEVMQKLYPAAEISRADPGQAAKQRLANDQIAH